MATETVETYNVDGDLVETREVEVPDPTSVPMLVTVDPQKLSDAQAAIQAAGTVTALRTAVLAALDLLNPGT
jgi:hypothetical protein